MEQVQQTINGGISSLTKPVEVSLREWSLFGLRWITPLGLGVYLLDNLRNTQALILVGAVIMAAIASNVLVMLALLNGRWARMYLVATIAADFLLALVGVAASDMTMGWLGLVPVAVAGFYFGWLAGLGVGGLIGLGVLGVGLFQIPTSGFNAPAFLFIFLLLLGGGPLAYFLGSDKSEITELRVQMRRVDRQAERISRTTNEYMRALYEMTEILSTTGLNPKKVLMSAVNFAEEALTRAGVETPIHALIMLFDGKEEGVGSKLRVARANGRVPASDLRVAVVGEGGVIASALRDLEPAIASAPSADPELREFYSLGNCGSAICLPLRSGNETYGVMLVGAPGKDAFKDTHVEMLKAVANQAAASLSSAQLYGALLEQRDRLVDVEKNARAQLASELHDGPTQGVAAISMRLNYIRKLIEKKPDSAVEELFKIEDLARRTTKEIRHMLFELRPMALEQGLEAGLVQLAVKMLETYEQKVEVMVEDHCDKLLDAQATHTLFSIVIETLNNARKHAQAERVLVSLGVRGDALVMEVSDNGVGFDVEKALAEARDRAGHLGLVNLQDRARLVDGTLELWSQPGQGSRTTVSIPMEILRLRKEEENARLAERGETSAVAG